MNEWFTVRSFVNQYLDDLPIFKSILECFSCTYTHKSTGKCKEMLLRLEIFFAYVPVTYKCPVLVHCYYVYVGTRNVQEECCSSSSTMRLIRSLHCAHAKDMFFQRLLIAWKIARKVWEQRLLDSQIIRKIWKMYHLLAAIKSDRIVCLKQLRKCQINMKKYYLILSFSWYSLFVLTLKCSSALRMLPLVHHEANFAPY